MTFVPVRLPFVMILDSL